MENFPPSLRFSAIVKSDFLTKGCPSLGVNRICKEGANNKGILGCCLQMMIMTRKYLMGDDHGVKVVVKGPIKSLFGFIGGIVGN